MAPSSLINALIEDVAPEHRESFRADYRSLSDLPGNGADLQDFLNSYLTLLSRLYAATAGAVWFRDEAGILLPKSTISFERLGLEGQYEEAHRDLLSYALTKNKSFLVKPFSAPEPSANASNPTDSFILLGPIDHRGERLGAVELFLGPTPPRGKTAGDRQRYVTWLDHLVGFLCQGIELRFLGSDAPLQPALVNLAATRSEIESFKDAIRVSLEVTLSHYAGWNFGSLRNNQTFTRTIHELLDGNGLRVECPECGSPAILRCQSAGNSKTGVFLYDHYLESGRTFHGGPSTFPKVSLVAKPPRRKANGN